jgi:replication-associated recombination protein RarA
MKKEEKTIKIGPTIKESVKDALVSASEQENRSHANMLEVMILEYCKNHNISYDNQKNRKEEK